MRSAILKHFASEEAKMELVSANGCFLKMAHCSIPGCSKDWRAYYISDDDSTSFHQFPKDIKTQKKWIVAVKWDERVNFKVRVHHFEYRWMIIWYPSIIVVQIFA